ncbi:MAG: C4-dicarboxylate ABC transporter substrate-binding protein [Rhodospirillaceae bacterium]|nr:MAG: C4-dicarboxylate ABC transporter substrate-binding protein [Rhodospirillaceae bacterium]
MNKDSLRISALGIFIAIIGFVIAYQFVEPSPPNTLTIATGSDTGAYFKYANRYKDILAQSGIELNVISTQGSVENIQLLKDGKVDLAFVQGGVGDATRDPNLVSLGSVYFEPLWVFVRKNSSIKRLNDLSGRKVAVGTKGSGTWAIAEQLIAKNKISTDSKFIQHLSSADSAKALLAGKVEAAFFVTSPTSELIGKLLKTKNIRLLSFERAAAYTNQMRYLSAVTLSQGVISLSQNIPTTDKTLLAPAATLATRTDLHPALQNLLIQAMSEVHSVGSIFAEPGQFPSTQFVDYPLSANAERYLTDGPPFLQRYLPFWGAVLFDRLKVMLVPLLTLLIPLMKIFPPAYRWRVRSRIYQWYDILADIERRSKSESTFHLIDELTALEDEVRALKVPLSYTDQVYNLRLHIDLIKRSL